jgi:hypothetical protein
MVALVLLVTGCEILGSSSPSPVASPSPHTPIADVGLKASEAPTGFPACPGSGPIDRYVSTLQATDPILAARVASAWQVLQDRGATAGVITIYATDSSVCVAELGAGKAQSAVSVVVEFPDPGQADRAWNAGVFGFVPPAPDQIASGIKRGAGTGLGMESWTYVRPPLSLACWTKSVFVSLVILYNLAPAAFTAATAAVDARLH